MSNRVLGFAAVVMFASVAERSNAQLNKTLEEQPTGQWVAHQLGMVAVPPAWQPFIGVGSVIYVDWDRRVHGTSVFGYRYFGKFIDMPVTDLPALTTQPPSDSITTGRMQSAANTGVNLSIQLGSISPSLLIGTGSSVDIGQSTFQSAGWGSDRHALVKELTSKQLQANLADGVYDAMAGGQRYFKWSGQGYLVTEVISAKTVSVTVTTQTQLAASIKTLKVGDCKESAPVSQLKKEAAAQAPSSDSHGTNTSETDTTTKPSTAKKSDVKATLDAQGSSTSITATIGTTAPAKSSGNTDSAPNAKTTFVVDAIPSDAKVEICHVKDYAYTLKVDPAIPFAFRAEELRYGTDNMPTYVEGTIGIDDLHDAMKHPD